MNTKHAVLIAALIWAAIFLPGLGSTELKGEEWRRVLPGRTMLQTGDWVVTYSGGKVYSRKPPLVNWAAAASFHLTGKEDEWSARYPCALAVLLLVVVAVPALSGWLGATGALAAAVFMMTNIGLFEKGRLAEIEPLYIVFYGIAILAWTGLWRKGASPWLTWVLPGIGLGLATLAKGPAPLLLFYYAPVIGVLFKAKRLKELLHPAHFVGIGLMLLIFLPWALANVERSGGEETAAVWKEQIASRLGFEEMNVLSWILQPPQALANFLPWVLFLPLLWIGKYAGDALSVASHRDRSLFRGLRQGLVVSFLLVAVLPTSRPRFTLPLLVVASVLVAWVLVHSKTWVQAKPGRIWAAAVKYGGWVLMGSVLGGIGFAVWKGVGEYVVAALPGAVVGWWAWRQRGDTRSALYGLSVASGGLACLVIAVYVLVAVPLMRENENIRPFGAAVVEAAGGRQIAAYKIGEKPFVFYLGAETREVGRLSDLPGAAAAVLLPLERMEKEKGNLEKKYGPAVEIREFRYSRSGKGDDVEAYGLLNFPVGGGSGSGDLPEGG